MEGNTSPVISPPQPTSSASTGTSTSTSTPSSPAAAASPSSPSTPGGGSSETSASSGSAVSLPEHAPPRRRLVKTASIATKREGGSGASGAATGPPGFGADRAMGASPMSSAGTASGTPTGLPAPSATTTNPFRERAGIRPIGKGDGQSDYSLLPSHGSGGTSGPTKLGRPPFAPTSTIMGDIRPLGRRPEIASLQRRHDTAPSAQKHAPDEVRIQQAKRAYLSRAQSMGCTGNYKNFDSPFGNYMVPVIPNQFFNKSPTAPTAPASPASPANLNPLVGR